ncbi:MAG: FAD-binding oxidoreductase [Deltaproteobacteria bacterium]|nr:MAG: FAD-binding oxidoreductase [Deltaproteobacteria bacterium]
MRSHWGWGWADRFPDAGARGRLGQLVSAVLGRPVDRPREPVPLAEAKLPAPRLSIPSALAPFCTQDPHARALHTWGRSYRDLVRGFTGDFSRAPDFVALPGDEESLERLLEWAVSQRVAVTPYGGGTSVVGGVECEVPEGYRGAISVDLARIAGVVEIDPVSHAARIRAGTCGPEIERGLEGSGLTLRHYPQSFEFSTLGGWIATRAAGHYAAYLQHIDERVESIRMLTPGGWWETRRLPGSGAGPDPNRLILGSEGTLGIVTEAWVRLVPRPVHRSRATVRFDDFGAACAAVREIVQADLRPANCRVLDGGEAMLNQVDSGGKSVLLLAFESAHSPQAGALAQAIEIARAHGGRPDAPTGSADRGSEAWKAAFLEAPYLFNSLVSLGVVVDTFETACPWSHFEALHETVTTRLSRVLDEVAGGGLLTCRLTHAYPDGPAPYYTFLAAGRRGSEIEAWQAIKAAAAEAVLEAGGTMTHHHAVGRLHRDGWARELPAPFRRALEGARRAVDPDRILNPGLF